MRRPLLIGLVALPAVLGLAAYGCSSDEPPVEDLCAWLKDPNNCYRQFAANAERPTTATQPDGIRCTNLSKLTADKPAPGQSQIGDFASRAMLDNCYMRNGGIVAFSPLIDLTMPIGEVKFTMVNGDTTPCGEFDFVADDNFKIHYDGDMVPDGGTLGPSQVADSSFAYSRTATRTTVTATCGTESHYFNRLQLQQCQSLAGGIPAAALEIVKGGLDQDGNVPPAGTTGDYGAIRFKVFLAPTTPANGPFDNVAATEVDYFTCVIPPVPARCSNGILDPGETDIDCGGVTMCPRCGMGMKCISTKDCATGLTCQVMAGLKTCLVGGSTSSTTSSSSSSSSSSSASSTSSGG